MENYDLLTPGSKQVNGTKNDSSINNIKEKKKIFSQPWFHLNCCFLINVRIVNITLERLFYER
jgi:hypothetical protein